MSETPRKRLAHPVTALLPALQRFVGIIWTTAGVEQSFAAWVLLFPDARLASGDSLINDELVLALDADTSKDAMVIDGAKHEWADLYGTARATTRASRLDLGKPGPKQAKSDNAWITEKAWIQNRREEVNELVNASDLAVAVPACPIASRAGNIAKRAWTEAHGKEERLAAPD